MENKFIKALDVDDFDQLWAGDTIKIYGKETTITGFSAQYNDARGIWETIIHTVGRGDPFERTLSDIEVLEEQPRSYEQRASTLKAQQGGWVRASERLPEKGGKENNVIVRGIFKEPGYNEWPFVAYGYRNFNPDKQQMYFEIGAKSYLTNDVEWLDESPNAYQELKPYDELYRLVFSNLAKLRARCQNNERMVDMADNIRAIIEDVTNKMLAMPQPEPKNDPWQLRQSGNQPGNGQEKEGEPKGQVVIHNNSDAFRHWVSDIKGYPIALLGHSTGVWLPPGVTLAMFEGEWNEYEKANNPKSKTH
jgi:hypothetical protein